MFVALVAWLIAFAGLIRHLWSSIRALPAIPAQPRRI
jgi:hypothetical protein